MPEKRKYTRQEPAMKIKGYKNQQNQPDVV